MTNKYSGFFKAVEKIPYVCLIILNKLFIFAVLAINH